VNGSSGKPRNVMITERMEMTNDDEFGDVFRVQASECNPLVFVSTGKGFGNTMLTLNQVKGLVHFLNDFLADHDTMQNKGKSHDLLIIDDPIRDKEFENELAEVRAMLREITVERDQWFTIASAQRTYVQKLEGGYKALKDYADNLLKCAKE